jgi:hypothetical protein
VSVPAASFAVKLPVALHPLPFERTLDVPYDHTVEVGAGGNGLAGVSAPSDVEEATNPSGMGCTCVVRVRELVCVVPSDEGTCVCVTM